MPAVAAAIANAPTLPRRHELPEAFQAARERLRAGVVSPTYDASLADEEDSIVSSCIATETGCTPVGFGRYRLLGVIGTGGMSTVFAAHDQLLDEPVAVKRLRAVHRSSKARAWLIHEAQVARRLRHPNVIQIHGVSEQEDELFLTMEYVAGRSLSSIIESEGALPLVEVIRIGHALADALAYIHANGVVHCDIKPDNIIIEPDGRVVLVDFGIAQYDGASSHRGGTPGYMAPEQAIGQQIDARTDIFGFGALLNVALMGPTIAEPSHWRGERPLPLGLARLVSCCLARDPGDRPSDMTEIINTLDALLREIAPGRACWRKAARG